MGETKPQSAAVDRPGIREMLARPSNFMADRFNRLKAANIGHDAGVVDAKGVDAFMAAAKTRQWEREKSVRTLA